MTSHEWLTLEGMQVCPSCGTENPAGFRFCGACGAALAEEAEPGREVRKRVTVVFCDLTGSTAFGDQRDPEAVRATMRRYYDESRAILQRHGGTVEKFIGDAVMAVFGVPKAHEDDALRAVRAAAELREAVSSLGLQARVGVNTGEVVAGEGDALVTGDAVNVAARLEQIAEPGEILLGEETRRLVRDAVDVERRELELRGKRAPVSAYRLRTLDVAAPGLARRFDSPLVGRVRELQRLRDDFEHALTQRSSYLFTLLGPAGVGKSRLVAEFMRDAEPGARVVRGRCLHYGEGITYWPLVEVLLQLDADPQAVLALPSPTEAAVATRKLLEQTAGEKPLVVVWDDIQWAEAAFLELIEHIADWSRGAPIFILCIARPELLELRPAWGGGKPNATSLLLEPLAHDEASTLIDHLLGATPLASSVRERILRTSEGNPLFVEEMLLMIREDGGESNIDVPPSIHALLQARLDRLPSEERSVIERGAVEGEVFHRSPVAELAPAPVRTGLDDHLRRLIRNELIRPEPATLPGDDAFRFRHLLIRDAAYEALPKETRADLHERFALWMDEHAQLLEQDEIVGYHLEQAVRYRRELGGDDQRLARLASERLLAAGRAAIDRGDLRAGIGLLDRAVELLPAGDEVRLPALPRLASALWEVGRFDDMRRLIVELDASGDELSRANAATLRPTLDALGGERSFADHGREVVAARETFERLGYDTGLARAYEVEGHIEWTACRARSAQVAYREGLRYAERAGEAGLAEGIRRMLLSTNVHGPIPVAEAELEVARIRETSRGMVVETAALRALGRLAAMRGDFVSGRALVKQGREPLADAGYTLWHASSSQVPAAVEELAGDLEAAIEFLRDGFDQLRELGEHPFASTNAAMIARLMVELQRNSEAADWLRVARELSPDDDLSTLAESDAVDAILAARHGEHERAERLADRAIAQAETTDFWHLRGGAQEALAEVLVAVGRTDEARNALRAALAAYEEKGVVPAVARTRELLAEL
jgi:class 3 adenylate cyclase/tetratricopeptide (TPR) repeat protein